MLNKKIIIFSILILFMLSIGCVSAGENATGDVLEADSMDALGGNIKVSGNTFDDIQDAFDDANENDVIELEGTYKNPWNLKLNKSLTIQGSSKGATLDFNNYEYYFCIGDESGDFKELDVVLKNLNFINQKRESFSNSLITCVNSNVTIINCTFINNNASFDHQEDGGAIESVAYSDDGNFILKIINSNFINCSAYNGGAIFSNSLNVGVEVINSTFNNNIAYCGGAISARNLTVLGSKFNNNKAEYLGGAIDASMNVGLVIGDCEFNNNYAGGVGSAVMVANYYFYGSDLSLNIYNSKFSKNLAEYNYMLEDDIDEVRKDIDNGDGTFFIVAENPKYSVVNCTGLDGKYSKTEVTLKLPKIVTTYKSGKLYKFKLLDKSTGKPIKNAEIRVIAVGKYYMGTRFQRGYTWKTDGNGVFSFELDDFIVGSYNVTVKTFMKYTPYKVKSTFKINKAPTIIKAPKVVAKYKKAKYFKVTVKNKATKKLVKNVKVKVKVFTGKKFKTFNLKTNKKGLVQLNTKSLKKGTHKVVISSGNSNYKISAKSTIKII